MLSAEEKRVKHAAYMREYNQRPEVKAKRKAYLQSPKYRAWLENFQNENRDKIRQWSRDNMKKYRKNEPDKYNAYVKKWIEEHKERFKEQQKKYKSSPKGLAKRREWYARRKNEDKC